MRAAEPDHPKRGPARRVARGPELSALVCFGLRPPRRTCAERCDLPRTAVKGVRSVRAFGQENPRAPLTLRMPPESNMCASPRNAGGVTGGMHGKRGNGLPMSPCPRPSGQPHARGSTQRAPYQSQPAQAGMPVSKASGPSPPWSPDGGRMA
jgi:hypothetical protein